MRNSLGSITPYYIFKILRRSFENQRYEGGIVYLLARDSSDNKKVAAHPCRHDSQTLRLGWMLRFYWSTSHISGRFPDLQIITHFSFSYSWVVQWNIEDRSLLTVTSSSGILTLFPLQNPKILHLIQQYQLHNHKIAHCYVFVNTKNIIIAQITACNISSNGIPKENFFFLVL